MCVGVRVVDRETEGVCIMAMWTCMRMTDCCRAVSCVMSLEMQFLFFFTTRRGSKQHEKQQTIAKSSQNILFLLCSLYFLFITKSAVCTRIKDLFTGRFFLFNLCKSELLIGKMFRVTSKMSTQILLWHVVEQSFC